MPISNILFLTNRLLHSPLEILFTLLVFILSKNLEVSPFQLTLLVSIKPISSFFAFYISSFIFDQPQRIRPYLFLNNLIGCLPCFFYPFIDNAWFYIVSYAIFLVTTRAVYPAWIEILKRNTEASALSKIIAQGSSLYHLMSMLLPPIMCYGMDQYKNLWAFLFMGFAILQVINMIPLSLIQIDKSVRIQQPSYNLLKKGWSLLKDKPAFIHYQLLFFLGGAGIIGSQTVLPVYFKENLNLTYTQLGVAFSFCKGISFVLTSRFWAKISNKISLFHLNCLINIFSCLYFVFVIFANVDLHWLYLAYLFYGTMQAGCEMTWNLSGPFFSGRNESTIYSSLNLAFVGIRGCICPFLSYLIFVHTQASTVFAMGALLCFSGIFYGLWIDRNYTESISKKPASRRGTSALIAMTSLIKGP